MTRFYLILTFLASIFSYGQVSLFIDVSTKEVKMNEPIVLTVVQEIVGDNLEQESPLQLMDLSKFDVLGNASERNTFVDPRRGIRINQLIYQLYLQPKAPGKVKIGSALVTVNGKIYKSEPFDLWVKESKTEEWDYFSKEVYLNLEIEDKIVYENQPTVAVLRAYSKNFENFRKLEKIQIPAQENAQIKPISYKKQDIVREDGDFSSQVVGMFVVFPKKAGWVEIEPLSAQVKNPEVNRIVSNKVKLNVLNLPKGAPSDFKNAVGDFRVSIYPSQKTKAVELGKPLEVEVKMAGFGNFDENILPKVLPSEDYQIFAPKVISHLSQGIQGIKGELIAKYVLIPQKKGALTIGTENFSFFDPSQNQYKSMGASHLTVQVLTSQEIAALKTPLDMVDDYTQVVMETVKLPVEKNKNSRHFTFNWFYILENFSLVLGGILLLYSIYRMRNRVSGSTPKSLQPLTNVTEEEQYIKSQLKPDLSAHLEYLKNLKNRGSFSEFFSAYDDFYQEIDRYFIATQHLSLQQFVDENKPAYIAESLRNITRKVSVEKFAPMHDLDNMDEIYADLVKIYSEILKE